MISSETSSVFLYDSYKLRFFAFVVGVKADTVDKGITVHNTDRDLCTKFCGSLRLPTDNRPDPRLRQAYDAVCHRMLFCHQHFQLLLIEDIDSKKPFLLDTVQAFKGISDYVRFYVVEIAFYASKLVSQLFANPLNGFPAAFIELEELASCYFAVCPGRLLFSLREPYKAQ